MALINVRWGILFTVAMGSLVLLGCGSSTAQPLAALTTQPSVVVSPGMKVDQADARLATDGQTLWLAKSGWRRFSNKIQVQVLAYRGGKWKSLPGRPLTSNRGGTLTLTQKRVAGSRRSVPCVGYTTVRVKPRVACFEHRRWRNIGIARPLRQMDLMGMDARGRTFAALFTKDLTVKDMPTRKQVRIARLKSGRLVPVGRPLNVKGQFNVGLGRTTTGTRPKGIEVGLLNWDPKSGQSRLATLTGRGWALDALPKGVAGGSIGLGPVRAGNSTYFPLSQFLLSDPTSARSFSVYQGNRGNWTQVGDGVLSDDYEGVPQGAIHPVGNRVWATWTVDGSEQDQWGRADSRVWAAPIKPDGSGYGEQVLLWSGKVRNPNNTQAISYRGQPVFVYGRQLGPKAPILTTVRFGTPGN